MPPVVFQFFTLMIEAIKSVWVPQKNLLSASNRFGYKILISNSMSGVSSDSHRPK